MILYLFLHLLPALDQALTQIYGYWIGLAVRTATHFGIPLLAAYLLARRQPTTTPWAELLAPFKIKPEDRRATILWSSIGCALAIIIILAFYLGFRGQFDPATLRAEVGTLFPLTLLNYLAVALVITFVNPLMEEYYWRGYLYRKWAARGGGIWIGGLFALHHLVIFGTWFPLHLLWILGIAFIGVGLFLTYLYKAINNLWAPLLTHIIADLTIVLLGYYLLFLA